MRYARYFATTILVAFLAMGHGQAARPTDDTELLKTRERVWRAWFDNDTKTLEHLVPAESIVFSGGDPAWKHQAEVLSGAAEFQEGGGKLVRLEFLKTEVQHFGDVAIVWSRYRVEMETKGKRSVDAGRISEIFVLRNGEWVNPGWHSDPAQP